MRDVQMGDDLGCRPGYRIARRMCGLRFEFGQQFIAHFRDVDNPLAKRRLCGVRPEGCSAQAEEWTRQDPYQLRRDVHHDRHLGVHDRVALQQVAG